VSGSERQPEIDVLTAGALFAVVAAGQPGLRLISDPLQAGLASIVELSQAQLQQTQALIGSGPGHLPVPFGAGSAELSDR
jgi:hypothetical protein